ncbi:hypothetical protein Q4E93_23020 [Flavitalea sp. BT771]|uniref:hypothetical protein n=1 Tax=Flavitalea sp. BT771 TaxID=3063329 RepID=UPI0026E282C3|nr:hypothetical protein [Flavitalea sp. BT771]MDO6433504.1 hypothetical protein [Flavitalea sp. BT771]MDV6222591.1 hypothetical protein [Flavitalea sp. BT771]
MSIKNISKLKFEAMIFIREPAAEFQFEEVEWFEAYGKLIAMIAKSRIDEDFNYIIFARDERRVFRFHDIGMPFLETQEEVRAALMEKLAPYAEDGKTFYEASPIKKRITDLFVPASRVSSPNPLFTMLREKPYYEAARNLIEIAAYTYFDNDGNFIRDFQTSEFNNRLWELFLHIYFTKRYLKRDYNQTIPDFCLKIFDYDLAVEAVTVNPNPSFDEENPVGVEQLHAFTQDYMPIKYHRTLSRKLEKKYHELAHVAGKPLLFAVHDYHIQGSGQALGSMVWTRQALQEYLYGYRRVCKIVGEDLICAGEDVPFEKIDGHHWKGASAPSGFFDLPGSEHVSAVLFASNATIPTFNRMGKLAELGSVDLKITRWYQQYNPKTETFESKKSDVDDPTYEEDWGDSVAIYHNPRALVPLDGAVFYDASHFYFDPARTGVVAFYGPRYTPAAHSKSEVPKL